MKNWVFWCWYVCSLSKSTRSRTSFWRREGRMLGLWRSREARTSSSSRSGALDTSTHYASSTKRRLISLSSHFLQVHNLVSFANLMFSYALLYIIRVLAYGFFKLFAYLKSLYMVQVCEMFCKFENVGVLFVDLRVWYIHLHICQMSY